MDMRTFLAKYPVFTRAEIEKTLNEDYSTAPGTVNARLAYHVQAGHIIQLQRGLYASVPTGANPSSFVPDPWLVASKLADDVVIAYRSAFQFHGRSYAVSDDVVFLSKVAIKPRQIYGCRFRRVPHPQALRDQNQILFGVEMLDRLGQDIRATSLERSLVDVLDRPDLGGGWEEIWRSAESVEYYDISQVIEYALLLRNATTAAKVGFFLEQHQEQLTVEACQLDRLREARSLQPHYLKRGKTGRLIAGWNLIVPEEILNRTWETEG